MSSCYVQAACRLSAQSNCDALRRAPEEAASVATSCHACAAPVVAMVDGLAPRPVALKFRRVTHAYYVSILEYSPPTIYPGQDSAHGGHTGTFLKRYVQKVKIQTAPRNFTTLTVLHDVKLIVEIDIDYRAFTYYTGWPAQRNHLDEGTNASRTLRRRGHRPLVP